MAKRVSVDKWLFGATLLLVLIGLIMVFSASAVLASERFGSAYSFLIRQVISALFGLALMLLLIKIDYRHYKRPEIVFGLLGMTTLLLLAVFFLDRSHHAYRWIKLGPLSLQPSELAKPALVMFLAYFLEKRLKSIDDWRNTLLPAVIPTVLLTALIVQQPDLGTGLICLAITMVILYVAGMKLRYFGYAVAASILPLYFLLFRVRWRYERLLAFMDPYADPQGRGFHMIQSLIAVGTGGISGQGLMEGKQKLFYLPEPHTDFIFAVVSEELGLLGALAVVVLFALFCYRGMRSALRARDAHARLMATGITTMIGVQALFNISVVLGLLPTKGIPLPFLSYGGSSLVVTLACAGILLNITQQTD